MRSYKVVRNDLGFTPDLSGCQNIEDISKKFKRDYPEEGWEVYEGHNHVKLWKTVKAPAWIPDWLYFAFASSKAKHVFEAHTVE